MFEVTTTGKNKNYGLNGEKRLLCDNYLIPALKQGWITGKFEYAGSHKTKNIPQISVEEVLLPIKKINVEMTLERQNIALEKLSEKISALMEVNKKMIKMVEAKE
jgi:hypothetical protein